MYTASSVVYIKEYSIISPRTGAGYEPQSFILEGQGGYIGIHKVAVGRNISRVALH